MGSPPRARGKDTFSLSCRRSSRITPACAGKRSRQTFLAAASQDHPRVRGEKRRPRRINVQRKGSPPRARGKALLLRQAISARRITPACAGKRTVLPPPQPSAQDHPRVRGEKADLSGTEIGRQGSPPRARGKVFSIAHKRSNSWITPACAGKRRKTA